VTHRAERESAERGVAPPANDDERCVTPLGGVHELVGYTPGGQV